MHHIVQFFKRIETPDIDWQRGGPDYRKVKVGELMHFQTGTMAKKFVKNFNDHMSLSDDHQLEAEYAARVYIGNDNRAVRLTDADLEHIFKMQLEEKDAEQQKAAASAQKPSYGAQRKPFNPPLVKVDVDPDID